MNDRRPVASLWIGEKLHYLNQLCLKSHVVAGHKTILYSADKVDNAPEGVEVRPASEIMEIDRALVEATSASFLSNVFRYKMIQKTGAIWIDCDAFCHQPFPEDEEYIFGRHGMSGALNCGVVGLPQECELMDQLLDYYDNLPDYPAWWNKNQRKVLYPVPFQLNDIFYDPYGRVEGHFTDKTLSVHLYTNGTKPWWEKNEPLPGSYAARMCEKIGIDPSKALR